METKEELQIVKVDAFEYGVEEVRASEIASKFKPAIDKMIELENEYKEVIALDIENPMTELKAKEMRLKYVKVRTATAAIHKQVKDFALREGKYIDAWKNAQLSISEERESKLSAIELHYENKEKERIAGIASARVAELLQYDFDGSQMNLGTMEDSVWINFLSGTKLGYEAKKAEEKRLAKEKAAKEKSDQEERERVAIENKRLQAEMAAKELQLEKERAAAKKELEAKEAIRLAEQKKADELLEAQRKTAELKAKKEKESADKKLKEEREAREKVEAELKSKQEAERKAEAAKQAEIKAQKEAEAKAAKAPEKEQLKAWLTKCTIPGVPVLKDPNLQNAGVEILLKFGAFKKWAREQIETL